MAINYTNKDNLKLYVADNIKEINTRINQFKIDSQNNPNKAIFDNTDIKTYLKNKLFEELGTFKISLVKDFESFHFKKNKIVDIANTYIYYKKDLTEVLEAIVFSELKDEYSEKMLQNVVETIFKNTSISDERKKFLRTSIKNITKKSLYMLLQNGFLVNLNNVESGVMTANAGDSAQFLFVSRAILAGFNCSNVDVRSSRYDAVIDYKNKIFRVQVKGVTKTTVSFRDRDRGGKGIDSHNERNIGKRITSEDCDIYVAVDKQIGMCYIIPMKDIDPWDDASIESVNLTQLEKYRENWNIVSELYDYMEKADSDEEADA
ncbi:hypothetical protein BXY41_1055 [Lacrimispora xylanisolvens]|uniref:PD(D/E)XK endonuclease domain-containing protein n=1 Tax=Lacrimispora xylanisolvens TaxID=384636 RepID=A0A2S6HSU8_9FIRM|nr:group I intron-associated PD-(D/E)XK endonuclease [Hungatella xylanolytica]PPK80792.1 hypothetical protein BXY41_1055 [Hungatella xylanolytica]